MVILFLILLLVILLAITVRIYMDTNYFKINSIELQSEKLPNESKFTVLQISDLHNKVFRNNNDELIQAAEKLKPDIIVITGDIIDRRTRELKHVLYLVEQLTNFHSKVFFVTGNHEWANPLMNELLHGLEERNVIILDNKCMELIVGGVLINLVGVADYSTKHGNIGKAQQQIQNEYYTVLLSHSPGVINKQESKIADLILSGHTHGGQIRLPFLGAVIVPDEGLFPKYDKGVFPLSEGSRRRRYLYIDSGLGTSRVPIRFLNQSQISLITIKCGKNPS